MDYQGLVKHHVKYNRELKDMKVGVYRCSSSNPTDLEQFCKEWDKCFSL